MGPLTSRVARRAFLFTLGGLAVTSRRLAAQEAAEGPSAARLETMRRLAKGVRVSRMIDERPGPPVALRPEPIARYGDPARLIHDATLWAWGERGRPIAALKVEHQPERPAVARWLLGLVSLAPDRIAVEFFDGKTWTSRRPGIEPRALPGAPAPADREVTRLGQMRDLAQRFTASEYAGPARGRLQLRLMPRPLHRYDDTASGPIDGAIFGFAYGTNPDVLLIIEAIGAGSPPGWRYSLARLGGGELFVSLDGREVWKQDEANPPVERETYMNRRVAEGDEPK
jgi:hypothetical protein